MSSRLSEPATRWRRTNSRSAKARKARPALLDEPLGEPLGEVVQLKPPPDRPMRRQTLSLVQVAPSVQSVAVVHSTHRPPVLQMPLWQMRLAESGVQELVAVGSGWPLGTFCTQLPPVLLDVRSQYLSAPHCASFVQLLPHRPESVLQNGPLALLVHSASLVHLGAQAPVALLHSGPLCVPVAQSLSAVQALHSFEAVQNGAAADGQALVAPEPKSPPQPVQARVSVLQATWHSLFIVHRPQKPLTLQLGAPCGHANSAPEPKLPLQAAHEPLLGPASTQNGAFSDAQAPVWPEPKLLVQLGVQTLLAPLTSQPEFAGQAETSVGLQRPQTFFTGSHSGPSGLALQSALLVQQTSAVRALSEAMKLRISCCDCAPPVEPVKPM